MKRLNKKGFTLVELLAVIVVLALLMVVAASSIGSALTNAKKNTLKTEAQKIITNVYQNAYSQYMLNGNMTQLSGYTSVAASGANYLITGKDGKYDFTVKVDKEGDIVSYCVMYNYTAAVGEVAASTELAITESALPSTYKGGAYTISDSATINSTVCTIS